MDVHRLGTHGQGLEVLFPNSETRGSCLLTPIYNPGSGTLIKGIASNSNVHRATISLQLIPFQDATLRRKDTSYWPGSRTSGSK